MWWSGAALTAQTVNDLKHRPMELRYSYDPEKWYLGTLCIHGHRWPGTELSLRRNCKRANRCAACCAGDQPRDWLLKFVDHQASGVPAGHRLGNLCAQGHSWNGTGYTLRKHGHCVECGNGYRDPEKRRASQRACYQRNIQRYRASARERMQLKLQADPLEQLVRRARSHQIKVRNRGNHHRPVGKSEISARFAQFDRRCAYCGCECDPVIEHFIPRSKGGPHAIGNILPACHDCNSSKTNHDPEEWYKQQPFFTHARWRLILKALGKAQGAVGQLPLL